VGNKLLPRVYCRYAYITGAAASNMPTCHPPLATTQIHNQQNAEIDIRAPPILRVMLNWPTVACRLAGCCHAIGPLAAVA